MYQTQNQNYGYQQPYSLSRPTYQSSTMTFSGLKGRPVSSFEEARASMVDFDGSVFYFPDLANRRIYTKQINMDGTALINVYELKEIPVVPETTTPNIDLQNFVTRDELNQAITQLREAVFQAPSVQTTPVSKPAPAQEKTSLALNF